MSSLRTAASWLMTVLVVATWCRCHAADEVVNMPRYDDLERIAASMSPELRAIAVSSIRELRAIDTSIDDWIAKMKLSLTKEMRPPTEPESTSVDPSPTHLHVLGFLVLAILITCALSIIRLNSQTSEIANKLSRLERKLGIEEIAQVGSDTRADKHGPKLPSRRLNSPKT